jgi:hypothetical protein
MKDPKNNPMTKGLVCRNCGCQHFEVLYTRPTWGGRLMRRRACRHCGRRITTHEQTADTMRDSIPPSGSTGVTIRSIASRCPTSERCAG